VIQFALILFCIISMHTQVSATTTIPVDATPISILNKSNHNKQYSSLHNIPLELNEFFYDEVEENEEDANADEIVDHDSHYHFHFDTYPIVLLKKYIPHSKYFHYSLRNVPLYIINRTLII